MIGVIDDLMPNLEIKARSGERLKITKEMQ